MLRFVKVGPSVKRKKKSRNNKNYWINAIGFKFSFESLKYASVSWRDKVTEHSKDKLLIKKLI